SISAGVKYPFTKNACFSTCVIVESLERIWLIFAHENTTSVRLSVRSNARNVERSDVTSGNTTLAGTYVPESDKVTPTQGSSMTYRELTVRRFRAEFSEGVKGKVNRRWQSTAPRRR